jgi:hypothetical protein
MYTLHIISEHGGVQMNKYLKWTMILFLVLAAIFAIGCTRTMLESRQQAMPSTIGMTKAAMPIIAREASSNDMMLESPPAIRYQQYDAPYGSGEDVSVELKIIKNGQINIEVDDFFIAATKVEAYAKKYDGYVSSSDANKDNNDKHRGTITIRVPEKYFDAVLAELSLLGNVQSKNTNGNDVTEQYIDLASRINNSKAHERRLLEMYDNATNVNELMYVENELSRVRGEIESMEGRLRYMDNKVEMSTITVYLYEQVPVVKEWGIWQSFKNALNNSLATFRWMVEFIGLVLPLAVFVGAIVLVVKWRMRKAREVRKR